MKKINQYKVYFIIVFLLIGFLGAVIGIAVNSFINERKEVENLKSYFLLNTGNGNYSLVTNDNENNWQEVVKNISNGRILGSYQNKIYILDDEGIKFYDTLLANNSLFTWINNPRFKNGLIVDDKIYYLYENVSNVYELNLKDEDIDSQEIFISLGSSFMFSSSYKEVYYIDLDNDLYVYEIDKDKKTLLLNNVLDFEYSDQKILYLDTDGNLKLYSLKSKKETKLLETNWSNMTYLAEFFNGDVYYKKDKSIIKWNDEESIIWTSDEEFSGFFNKNGRVVVLFEDGTTKFLIDGKLDPEDTKDNSISVKMLNGEMESFSKTLLSSKYVFK